MTLRSKLFATVALPVLSAAMLAQPVMAANLARSVEIAQATDDEQQRIQQEQQAAEQQAAEQAQQAAEQQAAEQQKAAEDAQKAAEQQAAEQAQQAAEQQAAEQQKAAEDAQKAAEQQAADEAQKAAAEQQKAAEQQAGDEAQKAADAQKAAEDARKAQEQQATDDAGKAAEQQKAAEDAQKAAEDAGKAAEQQAADEAQKAAEQNAATPEQPVTTQDQQPAVTEGGQQPTAEQPAGETVVLPVPAIVETQTVEEKQAIAADPAKTDETIVLPVENGAAVLDSDKDADNSGGQTARDDRRKQREELRTDDKAVVSPTSDAEAQVNAVPVTQEVLQQGITEKGRKIEQIPVFAIPGASGGSGDTVNNTVVNNNTVNNITVVQQVDNRTVLSVDDRIIVRSDDRPRLRRDSEESFYEELSRGRSRETIVRPNGSRIVTVYNSYGDIIQRSRVGRDGEEYLMVYAPEADEGPRPRIRDIGYELPPMRLRIPVRDYIIDTSSEPDRDYYDFLAEPPVEQVERTYSIDEVKYSARLRDKVRRIDLDTITFASGSADVPLAQAKTLRKVAEAMEKVLTQDPGETFLVEGHTDAVGKDQPNLILSDQRAESVAELLTDVYGIPAENLVTQGYGERFLKVRTQVAEQQNRRVTIRRVTSLIRPVARAQ